MARLIWISAVCRRIAIAMYIVNNVAHVEHPQQCLGIEQLFKLN